MGSVTSRGTELSFPVSVCSLPPSVILNSNIPDLADPEQMQGALAQHGRKMVTIVDPHIKRDGGYRVHQEV